MKWKICQQKYELREKTFGGRMYSNNNNKKTGECDD